MTYKLLIRARIYVESSNFFSKTPWRLLLYLPYKLIISPEINRIVEFRMESNQTIDLSKLIEEAREIFDELKPIQKWNLDIDKGDIKIHKRQDAATGLNMARGEAIVYKSLDIVASALTDVNVVMKWNDGLAINELIEERGDYNIVRSVDKKKPFVSQRETLVTQGFQSEDGSKLLIGKSINHPACPEKKEFVRAQIYLWSMVLTPNKEDTNKTMVSYTIFVDPKGWIPKAAFNAFITDQALNSFKVKTYVKKVRSLFIIGICVIYPSELIAQNLVLF